MTESFNWSVKDTLDYDNLNNECINNNNNCYKSGVFSILMVYEFMNSKSTSLDTYMKIYDSTIANISKFNIEYKESLNFFNNILDLIKEEKYSLGMIKLTSTSLVKDNLISYKEIFNKSDKDYCIIFKKDNKYFTVLVKNNNYYLRNFNEEYQYNFSSLLKLENHLKNVYDFEGDKDGYKQISFIIIDDKIDIVLDPNNKIYDFKILKKKEENIKKDNFKIYIPENYKNIRIPLDNEIDCEDDYITEEKESIQKEIQLNLDYQIAKEIQEKEDY